MNFRKSADYKLLRDTWSVALALFLIVGFISVKAITNSSLKLTHNSNPAVLSNR